MVDRRPYENPYLPSIRGLAQKVKAHWQEARPSLYSRLADRGELDGAALVEAELTYHLAEQLQGQGRHPAEAARQALAQVALSVPEVE